LAINLFRKLGSVLPGSKDQGPAEVEEDLGGFGPPGGVLWTTPVDVLSDRPKSAPPARPAISDMPAAPSPASDHVAPSVPVTPEPVAAEAEWEPALAALKAGPADPSTDISGTADISGFVGACLVDSDSGLMLAAEGGDSIDLEAAAALNTQVVRAEHEVIEALQLDDHVEDILITMTRQLHFIRPLEASPSIFLYVCLDKKGANLGMARMQVNKIEGGLKL
jgi:predicted regulator of Ras-like GTPase activity (Roadblock/LC7/MglB family)